MLIPSKSSCVIGCAQILAELGGIQKEEFGIATSIRKQVSVWKHVDFVLVDNTFVWKSLGPQETHEDRNFSGFNGQRLQVRCDWIECG